MKQTRKWIRLLIWLIALAVFLIPASALADSGGDNCTNAAIVFIAVPLGLTPAVVIVIIIIRTLRSGPGPVIGEPIKPRVDESLLQPVSAYAELDPDFSDTELKRWLTDLYARITACRVSGSFEPVREDLSGSVLLQLDEEARKNRTYKRTLRIDRPVILNITLRGFFQDNGRDLMIAELYTCGVEYLQSDSNGKAITDSASCDTFLTYEYVLKRETGAVGPWQVIEIKYIDRQVHKKQHA